MHYPIALSSASLEVKQSRFIAVVVPYSQFAQRLATLQREHSRASHYCTAARWLDDERICELASDDGEPSGTAGRPMLRILQTNDWINTGAIVVRYFGGTKLGTGGLAQAYSGALLSTLQVTGSASYIASATLKLSVEFAQIDQLEKLVKKHQLTVLQRDYSETGATLYLEGAKENLIAVQTLLRPF